MQSINSVAEVFDNFPALSSMDYSLGELNEMSKQWSKHFPKYLYGLYQHGITFKVHREEMIYFGGDIGKHDEYFIEMCEILGLDNKLARPDEKDQCICGVGIEENCYIVFEDDPSGRKKTQLIIGNCCIKRYIKVEKRSKLCFNCDTRHTNYKSSFCDSCRKICSRCGEQKHTVVERGMCIKCKNIETKRMEEENRRKIQLEITLKREAERHRLAEIETEIRAKRAREFQEAERIRLESERVIREKQREIDEADRATQLYLQKAKNQKKCECGKPITGAYPKCKTCFSKSKTCSMVGCNTKIMNPKYDRCYVCNKR
jgi:hypothetical protein